MGFIYGSGGEALETTTSRPADWSMIYNLGSAVFLDTSVYYTGGGSWRHDSLSGGIGGAMTHRSPHDFLGPGQGNYLDKTSGRIWATFAVRKIGWPNQSVQFLGLYMLEADQTIRYRRIAVTSGGYVCICDMGWGTVLAQSDTAPFGSAAWYACQVEVDLDTDRIAVYFVDAASQLSTPLTFGGTPYYQDSDLATFRYFEFGTVAQKGSSPGISLWQDDFFVNDDAGDELNYRPTYVMRAYAIKPNGNGYWGQWTGDYSDVDEVSPTQIIDQSDHIDSGTLAIPYSETHDFESPAGADNIHGVCYFVCARAPSGSNGDLCALERVGSTDRATLLSNLPIGGGDVEAKTAPCPQMRDAEGNNWTQANVNAAQWGVQRGYAASNPIMVVAYAHWAYVFRSPQSVPEPQPPLVAGKHYGWMY